MSDIDNDLVLRKLRSEVDMIDTAWSYYQTIYCNEENVTEWRASGASGFFEVLHRLLASEIIIRVARLFDPLEKKLKKDKLENIVFRRFRSLGDDFDKRIDAVEQWVHKPEGMRECRNKLNAHLDLATFEERKAYLFPEFPKYLEEMKQLLQLASGKTGTPTTGTMSNQADQLMLILHMHNVQRVKH